MFTRSPILNANCFIILLIIFLHFQIYDNHSIVLNSSYRHSFYTCISLIMYPCSYHVCLQPTVRVAMYCFCKLTASDYNDHFVNCMVSIVYWKLPVLCTQTYNIIVTVIYPCKHPELRHAIINSIDYEFLNS